MCPTVVVGTTADGETIRVRYRWGRLTVRLDPRDPAPNSAAAGAWIMFQQLDPKGLNGCLDYEEIRELTGDIIEWPDELSPLTFDNDDETTWLDLQD